MSRRRRSPRYVVTRLHGGWRITGSATNGKRCSPDEIYVLDRAYNHEIVRTYRLRSRWDVDRVEAEAQTYADMLNGGNR